MLASVTVPLICAVVEVGGKIGDAAVLSCVEPIAVDTGTPVTAAVVRPVPEIVTV